MQLTVWTYEGPPHVGAMRVATGMEGMHFVLHAPQGDTYADLLFTMIERRDRRPPVTYTTFQARDLGSDTASLLQGAIRDAHERFRPEALLVGASCTAELIQDDPGGLARALGLDTPVVPLELPSYSKKENWGAAETFYRIVRALADPARTTPPREGRRPRANLLGPTALGFRHRDDVTEITRLLERLGVEVWVTGPMGARPADIARIGEADINIVLYPETGATAATWLEKTFGQRTVRTVPIGLGATADFVREVAGVLGLDPAPALQDPASRLAWWSRSVDSTYLTGKRVFIFADATHAIALARVAREEMGFEVVGLGCYNREFARELRAAAAAIGVEPLVTDDYLEVEEAIAAAAPELVLGTQMERHIAKRLRIPCAVISAPVHVQDFPARFSPVMGYEGANVLFDTLVHPLVMGLEEHLLGMFREDFEFNDAAGPSHLGGHGARAPEPVSAPAPVPEPSRELARELAREPALDRVLDRVLEPALQGAAAAGPQAAPAAPPGGPHWSAEALKELQKIPFFVRGKARRNTEAYASLRGLTAISLDTLYDAKAHYAR